MEGLRLACVFLDTRCALVARTGLRDRERRFDGDPGAAQAEGLPPGHPRIDLAATLGLTVDRVSVKFKTAEKVGPVGEGASAEAQAIALLARA